MILIYLFGLAVVLLCHRAATLSVWQSDIRCKIQV